MADTLLFRKGSLAGLDTLAMVNGAISITTDEPGIYIDHNNQRLRIGDFIPVANLAALDAYKAKFGTNAYSKNALYYVEDKNMLVKWNGTDFVLINDQTALSNLVSQLSANLTTLTGTVNTHTTNIAANTTAIGAEKTRAEAAEAALGGRIDAILSGSSGDTLASLKKAIEDEATARAEAVAGVDAKATKAQGEVDALETVVDNHKTAYNAKVAALEGEDARLAGLIDANAKAVVAEKDRAMLAEADLQGQITSSASDAANAVAAEEARAKAAEEKIATFGTDGKVNGGALHAEITRATGREDAISAVANDAQTKANTNAESIANLVAADQTLTTNLTAEENARKAADNALGLRIDALVTESGKHATKTEVEELSGQVSTLDGALTAQGADIANLAKKDTELSQAITDEATERAGEITRVEGLVTAETAAREKAITDEVAARNSAIESAVNAAKATLNESINNNATNIGKVNTALTEEIARAKKAEEANAKGVSDNAKNIAANTKAIADEKTARENADTAEKTAREAADTQLQTNITNLNTNLSKAITDEAAAREQGDADTLASAKSYADGLLEAADAMRYMGTVGESATDAANKKFKELPTTGVQAGDTYVIVNPDFTLISGKTYKVGDLLVAISDQDASVASYPASGWSHVPTGYDASLDQELSVSNKDANNNTIVNGAKVALSSVMGSQEKGSLTIVGNTASNVKADLNTSTNTLTLSMVWEEWT